MLHEAIGSQVDADTFPVACVEDLTPRGKNLRVSGFYVKSRKPVLCSVRCI